jgi:hypothetical protein
VPLDAERAAGGDGATSAAEDEHAVVEDAHPPGLADPVGVDLELGLDPAVVGLCLELPARPGAAPSGPLDATIATAAGVGG